MPPLPPGEADTLALTAIDATDAAHAGEVADGYTMLLSGLARAREALEGGEEWAPELVARWERAVEVYAERWGVGRA